MDRQQGIIHGYSISFDYNCPVCGVEYELGIPLEHTEVVACPNNCGAGFTLLVREGECPQLVCVERSQLKKNAFKKEIRIRPDDVLRRGRAMSRKLFCLMSCLFALLTFCLAGCGGSSSSPATVDTSAYPGTYTLVSKDATYTYTSTAIIDNASPPAIAISGTTARVNNLTGVVSQLAEVFSALVITDSGVTFKVAGTDEKGAYNETYRGVRNANGKLIGTYTDPTVPGDIGAWNATLSIPLSGTYTLVSKDATYTYTSTAIIVAAPAPSILISGTTQRKNNADGTVIQRAETFSNLTVAGNAVTFKVTGSDETGAYNETYTGSKDANAAMLGTFVDPSKPADAGTWSAAPALTLAGTYKFVSIDANYTYATTVIIDAASPPTIRVSGTTARKSATGVITPLTEVYSNLVVTDTGVTFNVSGTDENGAYSETYTGVKDAAGNLTGAYFDPSLPKDLGAWSANK